MIPLLRIPKLPLRRLPRIPLSTTSTSSTASTDNSPTETSSASESSDVMTREEAYKKIHSLDWSTATKILFTTPPKTKKFGLDFHLVQLFFTCLPSLGIYLVAQYARYEMKRMEAEAELKKKQAEEEEREKSDELAPLEERSSDVELSTVLSRLDALENVVKEIVDEKKRNPNAEASRKVDQEVKEKHDLQIKSNSSPDQLKHEQNKAGVTGSSPSVGAADSRQKDR